MFVEEKEIPHEIFRVVSHFPRYTFRVISRKIDYLWDSAACQLTCSQCSVRYTVLLCVVVVNVQCPTPLFCSDCVCVCVVDKVKYVLEKSGIYTPLN